MNQLKGKHVSPLLVIIAFAVVYIVWGSTYFFIRIAVAGLPPFILGAFRFLISGLIMLVWCIYKKEQVFNLTSIKHAALSGFLLLFIANGTVIWVEQYLPSALVAIMVSAAPLWFVLLDKQKWAENFKNQYTIIGLVVGFAGIILLFYEKINLAFNHNNSKTEITALCMLIISSSAWAGGSLYSKYHPSQTQSASVTTAWQMLTAGFVFIPASLINGEYKSFSLSAVPASAWYATAYLIVFGSIAAFSAYVWLLQVRSATQVSTYAYVNPVVAVLLGMFLASENISWIQIAGLLIILGSVLLINLARYYQNRKVKRAINT